MNTKEHRPLYESIFWAFILILIILFWPKETPYEAAQEPPQEAVVCRTPSIYYDEVVQTIAPINEPAYGFTDDEIYLLTVLLCGSGDIDGDGEYDVDYGFQTNYSQIYLPLNIVMNRVRSERFPDTVTDVIWQPGQFISEVRDRHNLPIVSQNSYQIVKKWCELYNNHDPAAQVIPEDHFFYYGNGFVNKSRKEW